ncbi:MAG: glycosyltransferase, partial [Armatimonadota bacterium]|nr:glycosyltransferase [Armatimonadota bacterium]
PKLRFPGKTQMDSGEAPISAQAEPVIDSMNPLTWFAASRRINEFQPDMVVVQWWHPFFAPPFATIARKCRKSAKVVFLCHNVIPHESSGPSRFLTQAAFSNAHSFIAHSEEDRRNLLDMLPSAEVIKSPHPTYDVFNSGIWDQEECRREIGIDGNVILFFGLIRRYKGLEYLIEAMPLILEKIDAKLLIVGEFYEDKTPYIDRIRSLGIENRVIVIDRYVPNEEVGRYFTAADVVALPYVSATQSGIIQIAFGFGKPVIATAVGGLPETVADGETGYLVPPQNPEALACAIIKYFRESKGSEFAANISRVMDDFSWRKMVGVIESLAPRDGTICES